MQGKSAAIISNGWHIHGSLCLSGACHEGVAASTSRRHAVVHSAPSCRRQAEVERAQIILNLSQPGLPRSSSSSSPVFGRTPNAGPESSGVVLTGVGTAQMTKEGQAPLTDLTGAVVPYVTESHHWRQNPSNGMEDASETPIITVDHDIGLT